ncbi:MAG: hypothetical protein EXQ56_09530 [Acidobacteria bacterium]|nr:hypothetical protein [Acidobacteriota bacterium]
MATLQKQVKTEIAGIMDRYTGAMDTLVKAFAKRRNSTRDIYWLALQASKEFGAIRTHARVMMSRAKRMEPLADIKKSAHDSAEEIDHYYGYRQILDWKLNGKTCTVNRWWDYGDFAEEGGAGPKMSAKLWPEHVGYLELNKKLARQTKSQWVRDVILSNREGAAVAFHFVMSHLPAKDAYMKKITKHEHAVAVDELHHGPEMIDELAKTVKSPRDLETAKKAIMQMRIQELRQRNEQFLYPLSARELAKLEKDFLAGKTPAIPLFSTGKV